MLSYRDLCNGLMRLEIDPIKPIIVHASLSSYGEIRGSAETLLGALLANFQAILAPTFTYKSMIIPETGPDNNGIVYGSARDLNKMAEFYSIEMPADRQMGILAETIRMHPQSVRSSHPILSFSGIHLTEAIESQTLEKPFAPIEWLSDHQGYILLLGVDQTVNTSIHLAEQIAGRKTFTRWALTPRAIYECPFFPGCSDGFNQVENFLTEITRSSSIGNASIKEMPIREMMDILIPIIQKDPFAFLCEREICPRCQSIRKNITEPKTENNA